MKASKIQLTNIEDASRRFDPSYHLSDAVVVKKTIAKSPYPLLKLKEVSSRIFNGGRYKRVYVSNPEYGYKFLSSSDILSADLESVKMVSKRYMGGVKELSLEKGWILITRSGTIGKTAFANAKHAQKLASEHVIRLKPNNILRAGAIYAYLSSKYGYILLTQGTFGAVIQHIECPFVGEIQIPDFPKDFQEVVDGLIQDSARLREEAADELKYVKDYFNSKFIIPKENRKGIKLTISSIKSSSNLRFDATYYSSDGSSYVDYIKGNCEWEELGNYFSQIYRPDIFKRNYVSKNNGIMFLGSTELFLSIPASDKFVSKKTSNINSLTIQEGTILLPRSGTIGSVAYANSLFLGKLASEHVIRLVPKNNRMGAYTYGFLSSEIGKRILQRAQFGSVILTIEPPMIKEIPIPIFQESIDDISQKVISANFKLGKAGELELKAIAMVEAEIEKWN